MQGIVYCAKKYQIHISGVSFPTSYPPFRIPNYALVHKLVFKLLVGETLIWELEGKGLIINGWKHKS